MSLPEEGFSEVKEKIEASLTARAVTLVFFIFLIAFLKYFLKISLPNALFFILAGWLIISLLFTRFLLSKRSKQLLERGHFVIFIFGVFMLTIVTNFLGGIEWIAPLLYALTLLYVNFLLSRSQALIITFLASLALGSLMLLEFYGILGHQTIFSKVPHFTDAKFLATTFSTIVAVFFLMTFAAGSFAKVLNRRAGELTKRNEELLAVSTELSASRRDLEELSKNLENEVARKTEELTELNIELAILNTISESLSKSLSLHTILSKALNRIVKIFYVGAAEVIITDNPKESMIILAHNGPISECYRGDGPRLNEELAKEAIKRGEPLVADVSFEKPKILEMNKDTDRLSVYAFFPLESRNKIYGVLGVANSRNHYLTAQEMQLLLSISHLIGSAVENCELYRQVQKLSETDSVTGLYNHRFTMKRLNIEMKRAARYRRSLAVMMMDIDRFKGLNDSYGHQFGDLVLRRIAVATISACRGTDIIGRYGGDEFFLLLPETRMGDGETVAQRILERIRHLEFYPEEKKGLPVKITVSLGLAIFPDDGQKVRELVYVADSRMYKAKTSGGNCLLPRQRKVAS